MQKIWYNTCVIQRQQVPVKAQALLPRKILYLNIYVNVSLSLGCYAVIPIFSFLLILPHCG